MDAQPLVDSPTEASSTLSAMKRVLPPLTTSMVETVAVAHGVCVNPVPLRRIDPDTGQSTIVDVPCGATSTSKCPPCADRAKLLRMQQCRQGWHLEEEPVVDAQDPTEEQAELTVMRADLQAALVQAQERGLPTEPIGEAIEDIERQLAETGARGKAVPSERRRRTRSTKRRQDVPDLPRRKVAPSTIGRAYTARDGKVFRPSIFLTLTARSYGRVDKYGVPRNLDTYDYRTAARDAIHFPALVDRYFQNLRRVVGFEVQYFGALEPQRRLAPHLHAALRGTIARKDLRLVAAATYLQVWWPSTDEVIFPDQHLPEWDEAAETYVDPDTGGVLPTWDEALDAIGEGGDTEPQHVVRFGTQLRAEGVLSGSPDADRCIRYLVKYLNKSIDSCHEADTDAEKEHMRRLWEAMRYEPCSPTCSNWLRYGVQPLKAKAGQLPGCCRGKAHRHETLGFGGRRVLTSRKWCGKTLADLKAERREWVRALLGLPEDADPKRYVWVQASPSDPDVRTKEERLLLGIAARSRWHDELEAAKAAAKGAQPPTTTEDSSTSTAA
jgi:hypothetical protein